MQVTTPELPFYVYILVTVLSMKHYEKFFPDILMVDEMINFYILCYFYGSCWFLYKK
jgi:hypothetical protein